MEKVIARLSLSDLLGLLAPGLLLLVPLHAWFGLELADLLGFGLAKNELVAAGTILAVAYALGLLMLEWVNIGTRRFTIESSLRAQHIPRGWAAWWLWYPLLWLVHGMPLPRVGEQSFVEAQVMMSEFNEVTTHMSGFARISSPWDQMEMFRGLVQRIQTPSVSSVVESLSAVHSRLLFSLCLSLALALVAVTGLITSVEILVNAQQLSKWIWGAGLAATASFGLRLVAARCWVTEIALACSLAVRE